MTEQKKITREAVEAMQADTTRPEGSKYATPEYRALMAEVTKASDADNGIVREYVIEEDKEEETVTESNITPEVIEALATLREFARNSPFKGAEALAIDVLDNAGIFAAIDEATGYDVDPEPMCTRPGCMHSMGQHPSYLLHHEQVSKCTCPAENLRFGGHLYTCPAAPEAETVQCGHCHGDYLPKKDGTLRTHNCWKYDVTAKTVVYGPLDRSGRGTTAPVKLTPQFGAYSGARAKR